LIHWKEQLLKKYRTPEEIAALKLLRPDVEHAVTEVAQSESGDQNSLYINSEKDE
jgi:hypothetical protein